MSIRAKFRCMEVSKKLTHTTPEGEQVFQYGVRLLPVMLNKKGNYELPAENKEFWEATPAGEITLGVMNKTAADRFDAGKCYYVDFTEAP